MEKVKKDFEPFIEIRNLEVEMEGTKILDIPSLKIKEGETIAFIGPNGAGKSTLLQLLSFLLKPSRGEIYFRGQKVKRDNSLLIYRRKVAMVFQEPLLFDTTVFGNVASGLRIRGMKKEEMGERIREELKRFGIGHLSHRSARTLSGGEAQRTSLARAFAIQPEILLLDEPFSNLDQPTRDFLLADLETVLGQTKTTVIMATHDRLEALRLADRLAVMNKGQILQIGSPEEVMNQPVDEFVASFVGVESILTGKVIQKEKGSILVSVSGREIEAVGEVGVGETVALCIRPENVTLTNLLPQETSSARNVFPGKIVKITPLGLFYRIQLDCAFPLIAYITGHSLDNLNLEEGKKVVAFFKATSIHVVRKKTLPKIN